MIFKVANFFWRGNKKEKSVSLRQFVRNFLVYFACFRWLFFFCFLCFPCLSSSHFASAAHDFHMFLQLLGVYSSNIETNIHIKHGRLWKRQKGRLWKWRLWKRQKRRLWKRPKWRLWKGPRRRPWEKAQEKVVPGTFPPKPYIDSVLLSIGTQCVGFEEPGQLWACLQSQLLLPKRVNPHHWTLEVSADTWTFCRGSSSTCESTDQPDGWEARAEWHLELWPGVG